MVIVGPLFLAINAVICVVHDINADFKFPNEEFGGRNHSVASCCVVIQGKNNCPGLSWCVCWRASNDYKSVVQMNRSPCLWVKAHPRLPGGNAILNVASIWWQVAPNPWALLCPVMFFWELLGIECMLQKGWLRPGDAWFSSLFFLGLENWGGEGVYRL